VIRPSAYVLSAVVAALAAVGTLAPPSTGGAGAPSELRASAITPVAAHRAVTRTASLRVVPAAVGQTKAGTSGLTPFEAFFAPAQPGRPAVVQRLVSGVWKTVGKSAQDSRGRAVVFAKQPPAASYRAVAPAYRGARAVVSRAVALPTWNLSFHDDFSGPGLDTSKWSYRQLDVKPYGNRRCSQSRKSAVTVSGGRVHLRVIKLAGLDGATKKACPRGFFANGHIATVSDGTDPGNTAIGGGFTTKYGVLSARLKFARSQGQHGSFWSQGVSSSQTGSPALDGAEIDTTEYYGDGRRDGGLSHLVHWHTATGALRSSGGVVNADRLLPRGKEWSSAMHVYSVEWSPSGYVFRVDGHETFRTTKGVSQVPQFLILSQLTSDWELPKLKAPYGQMDVDWVRVWTRPAP
jgi:beta-glucanase (GH16 family)